MSEWTDELKELVIEMYEADSPTPETSVQIVKKIATEIEKTPNGVRMILSKANVYVSKAKTAITASSDTDEKPKRVSKADAIAELSALITQHCEVDGEILSKLTGKAAVYFSGVIKSITE